MMTWILCFWLIGADGRVFAHDAIHGFANKADCDRFGGRIPVRHGIVRWTCEQEAVQPTAWFK
jgi:hypothetical protein